MASITAYRGFQFERWLQYNTLKLVLTHQSMRTMTLFIPLADDTDGWFVAEQMGKDCIDRLMSELGEADA